MAAIAGIEAGRRRPALGMAWPLSALADIQHGVVVSSESTTRMSAVAEFPLAVHPYILWGAYRYRMGKI